MPETRRILETYQENILKEVFGDVKWLHGRGDLQTPWRCPKCESNIGFSRRGSRFKRVYKNEHLYEIRLYQVTCFKCDLTFSPFIDLLCMDKKGRISQSIYNNIETKVKKLYSVNR